MVHKLAEYVMGYRMADYLLVMNSSGSLLVMNYLGLNLKEHSKAKNCWEKKLMVTSYSEYH